MQNSVERQIHNEEPANQVEEWRRASAAVVSPLDIYGTLLEDRETRWHSAYVNDRRLLPRRRQPEPVHLQVVQLLRSVAVKRGVG